MMGREMMVRVFRRGGGGGGKQKKTIDREYTMEIDYQIMCPGLEAFPFPLRYHRFFSLSR